MKNKQRHLPTYHPLCLDAIALVAARDADGLHRMFASLEPDSRLKLHGALISSFGTDPSVFESLRFIHRVTTDLVFAALGLSLNKK